MFKNKGFWIEFENYEIYSRINFMGYWNLNLSKIPQNE